MAPLLGAISRAQWASQWLRQRANKLRHALRPEPGSSPTPAALINDLAELGVSISSVWDLVNRREPYDAAIPVLIEWLRTVDDRVPEADRSRVREGLVRALTIRAARPAAAQVMLDQFRSLDDPSGEVRWAIGNALSVVADDSVFDDLASIVNDRRFGIARQMVVVGLGRSKDPRAVPLLINLLDDDDVVLHAVSALGKLKAPAARSSLGRLLVDRRPPVRKAAKKALDRLPA